MSKVDAQTQARVENVEQRMRERGVVDVKFFKDYPAYTNLSPSQQMNELCDVIECVLDGRTTRASHWAIAFVVSLETTMKSSKRAERRHHNARLVKNRFKREVRNLYVSHDRDMEEELRRCMVRARKRLDTNVNCSCPMCGNPRRYSGFSTWDGGLTRQEVIVLDAQRDGMEEVEENA